MRVGTWVVAAGMAVGAVLAAAPAHAAGGPRYDAGTVYFNKTETAELTYVTGVRAVYATVTEPFARILADHTAEVMVKADSANVVGQCVRIGRGGAIGTYGGGYCE